jgi:hypothetical protein
LFPLKNTKNYTLKNFLCLFGYKTLFSHVGSLSQN